MGGFFFTILGIVVWAIVPLWRPVQTDSSTRVLARDGSLLYEISHPIVGHSERVLLKDISSNVIHALVASEDARFRTHLGVDWYSVMQSVGDVFHGDRPRSGASTIEMQVVKRLYYPTAPRTMWQKIRESIGAMVWSLRYSKDQTLEMYLNIVYFGNGMTGIASASQGYFGLKPSELSTAQSAMLIGLLPAPERYDPVDHPDQSNTRMHLVLGRMFDERFLDTSTLDEASSTRITVQRMDRVFRAPHAVERALQEAEIVVPGIRQGGYIVQTTIDPHVQDVAERAIEQRLPKLVDQHVTNAAVLVTSPKTGEILGYVGSAAYADTSISGAVDMIQASRPPGSALKPFLVFAMLLQKSITPATIIEDLPVRFTDRSGRPYFPQNYGLKIHGPVTVRDALGSSLNIPMVHLVDQFGVTAFATVLSSFGIQLHQDPESVGLPIILGSAETTMQNLVQGYAVLANEGATPELYIVSSIETPTHREVWKAKTHQIAVQNAGPDVRSAVGLTTNILADKTARYLSFGEANSLDFGKPVAAKTGTTPDFRDNWALGYTPSLVTGVWVGNADNSKMQGVSGISGAVPIWADVMQALIPRDEILAWPAHPEFEKQKICTTSGLRATALCQKTRDELFLPGTAPTQDDQTWIQCGKQIAFDPPIQYRAWAGSQRMNLANATCGRRANDAPVIMAPLNGDVMRMPSALDPASSQILFIAGGVPGPKGYTWILDGQTLNDHGSEVPWMPIPGHHTLQISGGSSVEFDVRQ